MLSNQLIKLIVTPLDLYTVVSNLFPEVIYVTDCTADTYKHCAKCGKGLEFDTNEVLVRQAL